MTVLFIEADDQIEGREVESGTSVSCHGDLSTLIF